MIEFLEDQFRGRPLTYLNPLIWLLRLYHGLYWLAWAANSRQQEYAADRHEIAQAGKFHTAAALVHLTVTERLPWVRLSAIAEACVSTGEPMEQIFAEQRHRVQRVSPAEWQDALRRELKVKTSLFDTHPCLKERLAAIGVSPRKALQLALEQSGAPVRDLFPDWERIEKELTRRLIGVCQLSHEAKMEAAQIGLGRPIGRR
jgi:Zn-dependent protease with chaperone function